MKKVLLFIITCSITTFAAAQLQWGIRAGLNASTTHYAPSIPIGSVDLKAGLVAGSFLHIPLTKNLALQPEILYSQQGAMITNDFVKYGIRLQYMELPVLLQYKFSRRFIVEGGPQAGYLLAAHYKIHTTRARDVNTIDALHAGDKINTKRSYKPFDISGVIGVAYQFSSSWGTGIRYSYGFSRVNKESVVITQDASLTNRVLQISLSYFIGKKK